MVSERETQNLFGEENIQGKQSVGDVHRALGTGDCGGGAANQ